MKPYRIHGPGAWLGLLLCLSSHAATVTITPTADTTLFESNPFNNLGAVQTLAAGVTGIDGIARALLQFDVAGNLPSGAVVTTAQLQVTVVRTPSGGGENSSFSIHRVLQAWGEGNKGAGTAQGAGSAASSGEATWIARFHPTTLWQLPGGEAGTDYTASPSAATSVSGLGVYTFAATPDLITDVQTWQANPALNFGWMLRSQDEITETTARRFGSKESGASAPKLILGYAIPLRIQDATVQSGLFQMRFQAQAGTAYFVERRSDVANGAWTLVTNIDAQATSSLITVSDPLGTSNQFYRLGTP